MTLLLLPLSTFVILVVLQTFHDIYKPKVVSPLDVLLKLTTWCERFYAAVGRFCSQYLNIYWLLNCKFVKTLWRNVAIIGKQLWRVLTSVRFFFEEVHKHYFWTSMMFCTIITFQIAFYMMGFSAEEMSQYVLHMIDKSIATVIRTIMGVDVGVTVFNIVNITYIVDHIPVVVFVMILHISFMYIDAIRVYV